MIPSSFCFGFLSLLFLFSFFVCFVLSAWVFSSNHVAALNNQDVKGLFLFAAAMVMLAALGVHFKLKQIYNSLVHSYQARSVRRAV